MSESDAPSSVPALVSASSIKHFRYYDLVMAAFVAVLLLSNIIGASKLSMVGGMTFGAGILFFPISYVIGDVLTEVYGYARARRVIWAGFGALIFMAVMSWVVLAMPPAPDWWCSGTEALTLKANSAIAVRANNFFMLRLLWVVCLGQQVAEECRPAARGRGAEKGRTGTPR